MMAAYAKTFDLGSCRDLLGKLERELLRLEYSRDRADRADHAANFAVWAWQLSNWVYAEIATRTPLRMRLADACGTSVEALDLVAFQRYVQGPRGCAGLACCRAIATAILHVASDEDRPATESERAASTVIALRPADLAREPDAELTAWQASQWLLNMGDGGEAVPDIELFQDVLQFWTDFIYANHIA